MALKRITPFAVAAVAAAFLALTVRQVLPSAPGQTPTVPSAIQVDPTFPIRAEKESVTLESVPPVVVKSVPAAGADDIDPALTEIKVTFSKDMMDKSWSWSTFTKDSFPTSVGDDPIHYEKDNRTCVMKVKLEPDKVYAIWLNSENFDNFKDAGGQSAVPYLLVFKTKKKAD